MGLKDRDYMQADYRDKRRPGKKASNVPLADRVKFALWRFWRRIFGSRG